MFTLLYSRFTRGGSLLSHDYVFWCGDFNYRVNMAREEVKRLVAERNYAPLLAADQLRIEHEAGRVFVDFDEAEIDFAPTYKYDLFSDDWDTSEKCRVPAWTDRVLWRKRDGLTGCSDVSCRYYGRSELKQSDHRPVLGVLDIDVLRVNDEKRERVFGDAARSVGPPDGSVILQVLQMPMDQGKLSQPSFMNSVIFQSADPNGAHQMSADGFLPALVSELGRFGQIRFVKRLRDFVWVAFMDPTKTLEAMANGRVKVARKRLIRYQV
jgi:hypothetical protein